MSFNVPKAIIYSILFSSVTQSCLTLCDSMDSSMPAFPVHHQLLELSQTHVHWFGDAIQPISSSVVPFSSSLQSFPASGFFLMSHFFASGGQSIGASASTSVLPMSTQDWFPLGLTHLISLQSKGLSRVFSNITVQKHQFLVLSFLCGPALTFIHNYWKNIALTRQNFVGKVMSLLFNMLSRLVIAFLPRRKSLLISWL